MEQSFFSIGNGLFDLSIMRVRVAYLPYVIGFPPNVACTCCATRSKVSGKSPGNHSFPLSNTHTDFPALAQRLAAIPPPYPEPMTTTSYFVLMDVMGEPSFEYTAQSGF